MRRPTLLLAALTLALLSAGLTLPAQPTKAQVTIQETPSPLVPSEADGFALASPKLFWFNGVPACPPADAAASAPAAAYTQRIRRVASHGGVARTLYEGDENCGGGKIFSNIVADDTYLYWLAPTGLVRLPTAANPGDPYQLVNALVKPNGQLADGGDRTYYLSPSGPNTEIGYVLKSNNQRVNLATVGGAAGNLQFDGSYVYFVRSASLYRLDPGVDVGVALDGPAIGGAAVTGYYAEGRRVSRSGQVVLVTNRVYIGQSRTVRIYNNLTGALGSPIYTSGDTTASVYAMTSDSSRLFVFETQQLPCAPDPCFPTSNSVLYRMGRGGASPAPIYIFAQGIGPATAGLTTDGTFLFWRQGSSVQQLANDAATLPQVDMAVTGIEVTQGIQSLSNSVPLIQNRRTFVRVYVQSTGSSVAGVTAQLSNNRNGEVLVPINPAGTALTVSTSPSRSNINQSFLFELPWSWTTSGPIQLHATLNPYKYPLEPNYTNDEASTATLSFQTSPTLSVQFFRLNYTLGGTTYRPRITDDVLKTYSWIMRAYPIGGAIGQSFKPTLWDVAGGAQLGTWVNQSSSDCDSVQDDQKDRALCASYYTNGWLNYYREHGWVPNTTAFYYGMISDASNNFPRGQAIYDRTSVGPAGTPGQFFSLGQGWDTDGSYADWYAGHEIGHSLGRAHPNAGSDDPATKNTTENCGHSRSDPSFPYGNTGSSRAPIGPADNSVAGFDAGDGAFGIAKAIYPSATWNDVMSYCSNQWVSDYTYTGMLSYMAGHPSALDKLAAPAVSGDFLAVSGAIDAAAPSASFALVQRLASVVSQPPLTPGGYALRLLNAQGGVLASYSFTPTPSVEQPDILSFNQVVNFVGGARTAQIVTTGGAVLASRAISASAPTISGVALQGAPSPVSGTVQLVWTAADADGDALTFDVYYSRDGGATFQPAAMGAAGSGVPLDTTVLGGSGSALLRVVASDGVNTAEASSAPFTMANKPPDPHILSPGSGTHIHYGQLVNFSGMAFDAQDGTVAAAGLVWRSAQGGTLGVGPLISLADLPVGSNVITLRATNSAGQVATTNVTVVVDDDLSLPGPTLSAGPGQIGWQVAAGASATQSAQLSVSNSGSGALSWAASSDQPWLTLSAASGSVADGGDPSTLTLFANPAGLAAGQTYSAKLTLTSPASGGSPAQTLVIPVTLSVGDVLTNVAPTGRGTTYLPTVKR